GTPRTSIIVAVKTCHPCALRMSILISRSSPSSRLHHALRCGGLPDRAGHEGVKVRYVIRSGQVSVRSRSVGAERERTGKLAPLGSGSLGRPMAPPRQ